VTPIGSDKDTICQGVRGQNGQYRQVWSVVTTGRPDQWSKGSKQAGLVSGQNSQNRQVWSVVKSGRFGQWSKQAGLVSGQNGQTGQVWSVVKTDRPDQWSKWSKRAGLVSGGLPVSAPYLPGLPRVASESLAIRVSPVRIRVSHYPSLSRSESTLSESLTIRPFLSQPPFLSLSAPLAVLRPSIRPSLLCI
jgi:hypothetical protein